MKLNFNACDLTKPETIAIAVGTVLVSTVAKYAIEKAFETKTLQAQARIAEANAQTAMAEIMKASGMFGGNANGDDKA
jgi:hypothetical protein